MKEIFQNFMKNYNLIEVFNMSKETPFQTSKNNHFR